jgi:hypothetical protein
MKCPFKMSDQIRLLILKTSFSGLNIFQTFLFLFSIYELQLLQMSLTLLSWMARYYQETTSLSGQLRTRSLWRGCSIFRSSNFARWTITKSFNCREKFKGPWSISAKYHPIKFSRSIAHNAPTCTVSCLCAKSIFGGQELTMYNMALSLQVHIDLYVG